MYMSRFMEADYIQYYSSHENNILNETSELNLFLVFLSDIYFKT
jgi:hypothetical protein